jgi:glycerophosphoryl diester phosphodiesterase
VITLKRLFKPIKDLMLYDLKKLLFLETIIKLIGIIFIYPLFRIGFYLALELSNYKYIANYDLLEFIFKPSTLFIGFLLLFVFALYLVLEYVYLVVLYDNAYHKISMTYKEFIVIGFSKFISVLRKYHIFIMVSALLFFLVIEYTQIAIFSSTINLSSDLLLEIQTLKYFNIVFYISFLLLIIFFMEFIFFTHSFVIKGNSVKNSFIESRKTLKGNRFKLMGRFFIYNLIINAIMLLVYGFIILIIGLFVLLYRGEDVVFGIIITSMYTSYWIIGVVFSSILIPLNIAIASYKYYQRNQIEPKNTEQIRYRSLLNHNLRWLLRPVIIIFIIVFLVNFFTITDDIRHTDSQFQFFKQEEIIAHRGASSEAPENTLAAIELAVQQGVDGIEIDIQGTKDHVPIILHDATLYRTTDFTASIPVNRLDYEFIEGYDAGSWFSEEYSGEKVPKLEDVFEQIQGNPTYFLDIKTKDIIVEEEIMRLIDFYDLSDSIKLMSFDPDQLLRFKRINPDVETVLLIATFYGNINMLIRSEYIDNFALRITVLQNHPDVITKIHAEGKNAYAWAVESDKAINIGVHADVDGFITKNPIVAREIAHSKNSNLTFKEFLENLFKRS